MEVEINVWGVVLAAVAAMIIGAVWYAKALFGNEWMKQAKINEDQAKKEAPKAMFVMAVMAFVAAFVLAHVTYLSDVFFADTSYQMAAIQSGFLMWLGFVLYAQLSNAMFEQRPPRLTMINVGNSLVTFLAMGAVIGAVGL